jgi:hypothetical protein
MCTSKDVVVSTTVVANPYNAGGYVAANDSPVAGMIASSGAATGLVKLVRNGIAKAQYCDGVATGGVSGVYKYVDAYSCSDNTVSMNINNYIRSDTLTNFTGTLCVKTDTYQ